MVNTSFGRGKARFFKFLLRNTEQLHESVGCHNIISIELNYVPGVEQYKKGLHKDLLLLINNFDLSVRCRMNLRIKSLQMVCE